MEKGFGNVNMLLLPTKITHQLSFLFCSVICILSPLMFLASCIDIQSSSPSTSSLRPPVFYPHHQSKPLTITTNVCESCIIRPPTYLTIWSSRYCMIAYVRASHCVICIVLCCILWQQQHKKYREMHPTTAKWVYRSLEHWKMVCFFVKFKFDGFKLSNFCNNNYNMMMWLINFEE